MSFDKAANGTMGGSIGSIGLHARIQKICQRGSNSDNVYLFIFCFCFYGPLLNAGFVDLWFFRGSGPVLNLCDFPRGGSGHFFSN